MPCKRRYALLSLKRNINQGEGGTESIIWGHFGELQFFTAFFQVSSVRARLEEVESEALAAKEETATLREVMLGSKVS